MNLFWFDVFTFKIVMNCMRDVDFRMEPRNSISTCFGGQFYHTI